MAAPVAPRQLESIAARRGRVRLVSRALRSAAPAYRAVRDLRAEAEHERRLPPERELSRSRRAVRGAGGAPLEPAAVLHDLSYRARGRAEHPVRPIVGVSQLARRPGRDRARPRGRAPAAVRAPALRPDHPAPALQHRGRGARPVRVRVVGATAHRIDVCLLLRVLAAVGLPLDAHVRARHPGVDLRLGHLGAELVRLVRAAVHRAGDALLGREVAALREAADRLRRPRAGADVRSRAPRSCTLSPTTGRSSSCRWRSSSRAS